MKAVFVTVTLSVLFSSGTSAFVVSPLPTLSTRRTELVVPNSKHLSSPWQQPSAVLIPSGRIESAGVGPLQESNKANDVPVSPLVKLASSPLGALIVLLGVVLIHESGHYLTARGFGIHPDEFSIGFGPKLFGFRAFGDAFNLRALPMGGYVSLPAVELVQLPWQQRVFIASAGVFFNLILAFTIYYNQVTAGEGLSQLIFDQGILVSAVGGRDAAASGKLHQGDVIVGVNGVPITMSSQSPSEAEAQRAISKIIEKVQTTPDGEQLQLSVLRSNRSKQIDVSITPKRMASSQSSGTPGPQTIGVLLEPNLVGVEMLAPDSPLEAAFIASKYVLAVITETAIGVRTFAGDFFSGKAESSDYRVSGPIGVIQRASEVVSTQDLKTVLMYAAGVSINFGVINTLPIPPADGFQVLFILAQALFTQSHS